MANAIAYGFLNLENIFDQRVDQVDIEEISTAITESLAEHNRQTNTLLDLFATRTTAYSARYKQSSGGQLQPLDQNGRAMPVLPAGYYDLAFPIRDAGTAWGANFKAKAKMTVEDANRITAQMLAQDATWVRNQMLGQLFNATNFNYTDPDKGTLVVKPIANGDTDTYLRTFDTTATTDTHQLAQAAAIADATDPYTVIEDELTEHVENSGEVISLIASNLVATTKALTSFHEVTDPNIRIGLNQDELIGRFGGEVPGEIIGYHDDGVWIAEWKSLPSSYIISTMTGGPRPLAMREEPESELQGFIQVPDPRIDHPFYEQQYVRFAGFGAWNRVGATVTRIGNGTYAVPTGYQPPF